MAASRADFEELCRQAQERGCKIVVIRDEHNSTAYLRVEIRCRDCRPITSTSQAMRVMSPEAQARAYLVAESTGRWAWPR